ncbi:MAG: hypothetical protein IJ718_07845 [Paludibacteraceae bacterium]|nr:hypothetical protein [Paludibacteraceae bacterium]
MSDAAKSVEIDLNGHTMEFNGQFLLNHGKLKITNSKLGEDGVIDGKKGANLFFVTGSTNKTVDPSVDGADYFTHLYIGKGVTVRQSASGYSAAIRIDVLYSTGGNSSSIPVKPTLTYATNIFAVPYIAYDKNDKPYIAEGLATPNKGVAYGVRIDVYGTVEGQKYGIQTGGYLGSKKYYDDKMAKLNDIVPAALNKGEVTLASIVNPNNVSLDLTKPFYAQVKNAKTVNKTYTYDAGDFAVDNIKNHTFGTDDDEKYSSYVHIYPSGVVKALEDVYGDGTSSDQPFGIYAGGYGRWKVEGTVTGCTGALVKSGIVDFENATVEGTGSKYNSANNSGSGSAATGCGIVISTEDSYVGESQVTITGDSYIAANNGYALEEIITTGEGDSKVDAITIDGGTFAGGNVGTTENPKEGTITITEKTAGQENTVYINGLSVTGTAGYVTDEEDGVSIGGKTLEQYFASTGNTIHITTIPDGDGSSTYVISAGPAPVAEDNQNSWADVAAYAYPTHSIVVWTGTGNPENTDPSTNNGYGVIESGTVTLGELQMQAGTGETNMQVLVIKDGACLNAQNLIMNNYAKIIVNPGGKLIVAGKQGIYAPSVENIVLESDFQTKKYATFLFNPAVSSNKHPNATVEFGSYSYFKSASDYQTQRFGVPTWETVTSIKNDVPGLRTRIQYWGANGWENLGDFIQGTSEFANINRLNKPFDCYIFMSYQNNPGAKYTMTGKLVGNVNNVISTGFRFTPFANSYTADLDIVEMLNNMTFADAEHDRWIYVATPMGNNGYSWQAVDEDTYEYFGSNGKIAPLQPFIMHITGDWAEDHELNYEKMVWDPVMDPTHAVANGAPRRAASVSDNTAKLRVVVSNEQGELDDVKMIESTSITKRAEKYMNDDVNIYAHTDVNSAVVMNDNLEDTYFGFSTVNGGEFTISFANVEGREFDLIDLETGVKVAVKEGETYSFSAAANTVADYRFKLVGRANAPTAIENTEAVKSVKGIYTITGQYLGEMNVWNTLPAGVYVVNGEKCVK